MYQHLFPLGPLELRQQRRKLKKTQEALSIICERTAGKINIHVP